VRYSSFINKLLIDLQSLIARTLHEDQMGMGVRGMGVGWVGVGVGMCVGGGGGKAWT
jgi:hypothetical protein